MLLRLMAVAGLVEELLLMVGQPAATPTAVGSNSTFGIAVWFGLSVIGKLLAKIEEPVPRLSPNWPSQAKCRWRSSSPVGSRVCLPRHCRKRYWSVDAQRCHRGIELHGTALGNGTGACC